MHAPRQADYYLCSAAAVSLLLLQIMHVRPTINLKKNARRVLFFFFGRTGSCLKGSSRRLFAFPVGPSLVTHYPPRLSALCPYSSTTTLLHWEKGVFEQQRRLQARKALPT